jgi:signal transduction histidine kinase
VQVITCIIVLGLCITIFLITEIKSYKARKVNSIEAIAKIIGSNNIAAIQFFDNDAAKRSLSVLSLENDILNAIIFDKKNIIFASYTKKGAKHFLFNHINTTEKKIEFVGGQLFVCEPIYRENELYGIVCLQVELSQLNEIIYERLTIAVFLLFFGVGLAFLIAILIQRYISKPLLNLVSVMQEVRENRDYKKRSDVFGKDEISILSLEFNNMLEQIQKRDNELELRVKNRTEELELANKELSAFSYSVAHDLKSPLRAINGFSKILKNSYESKLDDEGKNLLKLVIDNSTKLSKLIDDLLEFSKMQKREMTNNVIDMSKTAKEVYDELIVNEKDRIIDFKINPLPPANGDYAMLKQVWTNLISNALKYSRKKEKAEIEIGSKTTDNEIIYFIKDNGAGFDMAFIDKLFGVFQRLHSTEEFEGNGVGLALVKRIIERHNGKVWAEGKVNEGATFYFSFPRQK